MKPEKLLKFIIATALSLTLFGCRPDLKIDSLTHSPENPTTKDTITFTARVKNVGFKEAGPSTLGLKVGGETKDTQDEMEPATGVLYIGTGKAMEPGTYWSGLIDDVRIYNRAVIP